ncbi:MAG: hypothetical protein AAGA56_26990 [Myxococcota bacterium]
MDAKVVLSKVVLADLLDESILGARPDDHAFPLRSFFGLLGQEAEADLLFSLACGLNFYFRAAMGDEERATVGLEVSRLYYRFAQMEAFDPGLREQAAPLLAELLSTELSRLELVSVDRDRIFDSSRHERGNGADPTRSAIRQPMSFACLVSVNGNMRLKAQVLT